MNRQQRRKAERRGYFDRETMAVATTAGHHFRVPEKIADIPAKVLGRHRWILSSAYNVTDSEAASAHEGVTTVLMGPEKLVSFGIGCWDCEQVYGDIVTSSCPGDPSGVDRG